MVDIDVRHARLAEQIRACDKCKGMNKKGKTQSAPGFGNVRAPVVIVGQSLCGPCMAAQEPFKGGTGKLLDQAFVNAGRDKKRDLYITNVVHCHPKNNVSSEQEWIDNCAPYLTEELDIVRPRLVIGLGGDARTVLAERFPASRRLPWPLLSVDGLTPPTAESPDLLFPTHPGAFRWKPKDERDRLTAEFVKCLEIAVRWGFDLNGGA
ncbi:uracil-DNA glycosylase family protein [Mycobacterium sp. shizuoka-1]|uniref:uracil-DNA glycosylase family protein n=1 Tax=Mycobacterium sp. shizuoka-1 TaxID=2039281 RepID=UPI000C05E757|nr:uracil-DNA glycosylase family protein [Mycobacterium sp. shizuoka-1]GAY14173.1 hypothetical protein MSZK_08990 [Mycobacterium sp. shizuoka-1]